LELFTLPSHSLTFYDLSIFQLTQTAAIPRLSQDGEFSERKVADQKFFSVSGMGFGQQPVCI
jgi:hypothetical protein